MEYILCCTLILYFGFHIDPLLRNQRFEMTTYAALVSLMNLLNRVQHPTCQASFEVSKIQSLVVKVGGYFSRNLTMILIESYVLAQTNPRIPSYTDVDPIIVRYSGNKTEVYDLFCQDLGKAICEMDFIIQKAMEVKEMAGEVDQLSRSSVPIDSSIPSLGEIKMVGFDEHSSQLMEKLYTNQPNLVILPVVGMGGIGKSTLARSIYNNQYSKDHFDVRAWVTISQEYADGTIVRALLKDIGVSEMGQRDNIQLVDQLYKYLFQRKYLIVLDDIWSSLAWEEVRRFFPDNKNGSRVLLTTRLMNVAVSVGSCHPYELKLLTDDKSWDLLCATIFGQDICPPELEKCGKKIAKCCKGLPLAIVVVGGLLKMSPKSLLCWQHVEKNVTSLVNAENDGHCMKILSLSYRQLPTHLKSCFLYMATFPEDCDICVSELLMLWVADGFLKPNDDMVCEEVASEYLEDLICRNLIIVKQQNSLGKSKIIVMHDLVRDLCVTEALKERFLYERKNVHALESQETIESQRRIVTYVQGPQHHSRIALTTKLARSLVWFGDWNLLPYDSWLSLVRIFFSFQKYSFFNISQLVNSRFLKFSIEYPEKNIMFYTRPPPWNLETLIVHDAPTGYTLPWEIWELPHLRHFIFRREVIFPDHDRGKTDYVLGNLLTLKTVVNFCFSDEVLNRIPNIKKLGVIYYHGNGVRRSPRFSNVVRCEKLDTLTCTFRPPDYLRGEKHNECLADELKALKLTTNLRKLTLSYSRIPWQNIGIVSTLPNLEVLKLKNFAFSGKNWDSVDREFQRLKVLSISHSELVTWTADDCSLFPVLEHFSLSWVKSLQEIPIILGEVASLKSIKLLDCGVSVIKSAKKIQEKQQEEQGTDDLTIEAYYVCEPGDEIAELENLANDNFHIEISKIYIRS